LPRLHAAGGAQAEPPKAETPAKVGDGASAVTTFELRVVGPDRKPVPEAHVEIRTTPLPEVSDVLVGRFVGKRTYGTDIRSDGDGRVVIRRPKPRVALNANITPPGYGPYWAAWSAEQPTLEVPARFTAELESAWSVGVVVVDPEGKPVEGVRISPSIWFKKRPGDLHQLGMGSNAKTDAQGRWRFDSVPASLGEVHVEINHPTFKAVRRPLTRSEFGLAAGREPSAKVVLEGGLSFTGRVTDEAGKPIAGALIRTTFMNDLREAKTGEDGVYHMRGCEPVTTRIVVSAKGKALDMKEMRVDPAMGPVDFQMKPGGKVRVRVLNLQGKAVPKARIFFQRWRGSIKYFEFDHVNEYADANGNWGWDEAPLDEFKADICPPGGMQMSEQPLLAREEEYVFRTPPLLVISGSVLDAKTKEPIRSFRVVPGIRFEPQHTSWTRGESFQASAGRYRFSRHSDYLAHMVRIEADGYQSKISRDIKSNEGEVTIDFALERGRDVAAKVVTPESGPAVGAKVALGIAGSQINIHNGDIDDSSTYASRLETNDAGVFRFSPQDRDFQLVITHPSGYAHIKSTPDWPVVKVIRLQPWSRVEGTFRVARNALANIPMTISVAEPHSYGPEVPSVFTSYDVTTGPEGKYAFERVVPGRGRI
ncbi:carboxypeptidase-like regulatory domain-containing protein, partial [Singulisphaera rosea]